MSVNNKVLCLIIILSSLLLLQSIIQTCFLNVLTFVSFLLSQTHQSLSRLLISLIYTHTQSFWCGHESTLSHSKLLDISSQSQQHCSMCVSLGNCDVFLQAIPYSRAKFSHRLVSTAAAGYSRTGCSLTCSSTVLPQTHCLAVLLH